MTTISRMLYFFFFLSLHLQGAASVGQWSYLVHQGFVDDKQDHVLSFCNEYPDGGVELQVGDGGYRYLMLLVDKEIYTQQPLVDLGTNKLPISCSDAIHLVKQKRWGMEENCFVISSELRHMNAFYEGVDIEKKVSGRWYWYIKMAHIFKGKRGYCFFAVLMTGEVIPAQYRCVSEIKQGKVPVLRGDEQ